MSSKCPACGGPTIPGFHYKNYCKAECDLKGNVKPESNTWGVIYSGPVQPQVVVHRTTSQQGTYGVITIPAYSFVRGAIKYAAGISLRNPVGYKFKYTTNNLYDTAVQSDGVFAKRTPGYGTGEVLLLTRTGKAGPFDIWEVELIRYP